jgi:hypothetical protein
MSRPRTVSTNLKRDNNKACHFANMLASINQWKGKEKCPDHTSIFQSSAAICDWLIRQHLLIMQKFSHRQWVMNQKNIYHSLCIFFSIGHGLMGYLHLLPLSWVATIRQYTCGEGTGNSGEGKRVSWGNITLRWSPWSFSYLLIWSPAKEWLMIF